MRCVGLRAAGLVRAVGFAGLRGARTSRGLSFVRYVGLWVSLGSVRAAKCEVSAAEGPWGPVRCVGRRGCGCVGSVSARFFIVKTESCFIYFP